MLYVASRTEALGDRGRHAWSSNSGVTVGGGREWSCSEAFLSSLDLPVDVKGTSREKGCEQDQLGYTMDVAVITHLYLHTFPLLLTAWFNLSKLMTGDGGNVLFYLLGGVN